MQFILQYVKKKKKRWQRELCINHSVETHTEMKTPPSPAGVMASRENCQ